MKNLTSEYNAGNKSGKARIVEVGASKARMEGQAKLDLCHSRGASTLSFVYWLGYLDAVTYHKKDGSYTEDAPKCPTDLLKGPKVDKAFDRIRDIQENEKAFIRDCQEFNRGRSTVNPYVTNKTSYGISSAKSKRILTKAGVFHPVYNPAP